MSEPKMNTLASEIVQVLIQKLPIDPSEEIGDSELDKQILWLLPPILAYITRCDTELPYKEDLQQGIFLHHLFPTKLSKIKTSSSIKDCIESFDPPVKFHASFLSKIMLKEENESWSQFRTRYMESRKSQLDKRYFPPMTSSYIKGLLSGWALKVLTPETKTTDKDLQALELYQAFQFEILQFDKMVSRQPNLSDMLSEESDEKGSPNTSTESGPVVASSDVPAEKTKGSVVYDNIIDKLKDLSLQVEEESEQQVDDSESDPEVLAGEKIPTVGHPSTSQTLQSSFVSEDPPLHQGQQSDEFSTDELARCKESLERMKHQIYLEARKQVEKEMKEKKKEEDEKKKKNKSGQTAKWIQHCSTCHKATKGDVLEQQTIVDALTARREVGKQHFWCRVGDLSELAEDMRHTYSTQELILGITSGDEKAFDEMIYKSWCHNTLKYIRNFDRLSNKEIKVILQVKEEISLEERIKSYFANIDIDAQLGENVRQMLAILKKYDIREISKSTGSQAFASANMDEPRELMMDQMLANKEQEEVDAMILGDLPKPQRPRIAETTMEFNVGRGEGSIADDEVFTTRDGSHTYKKKEIKTDRQSRRFILVPNAFNSLSIYYLDE